MPNTPTDIKSKREVLESHLEFDHMAPNQKMAALFAMEDWAKRFGEYVIVHTSVLSKGAIDTLYKIFEEECKKG